MYECVPVSTFIILYICSQYIISFKCFFFLFQVSGDALCDQGLFLYQVGSDRAVGMCTVRFYHYGADNKKSYVVVMIVMLMIIDIMIIKMMMAMNALLATFCLHISLARGWIFCARNIVLHEEYITQGIVICTLSRLHG